MQRTGLRANLLFILATACMVALVGRLCYIHACYVNEPVDEEGKTLAEHVEQQQRTTITIPPAAARFSMLATACSPAARICPASSPTPA